MVLIEGSSLRDFYPNKMNTFKQNINAIARLIIIFGLVLTLLTMNTSFGTEALKYLVLLGVVSFVYISSPPKEEEKYGNRQRFVDSGGIDGGIGSPNKWGGLDYREKFTPEPRMSLIGSPSYDERNIDLRKLAIFDKNLINLRSTTAGFPTSRYI